MEASLPLRGRMLFTNLNNLSTMGGGRPEFHSLLQALSQSKGYLASTLVGGGFSMKAA
jgi:hypothetical protein